MTLNQNSSRLSSTIFVFKHFFAILLVLMAAVACAQQRLFTNQQHFGVEEGLPQSFISGIIQDEDGFIWLATLDGFCRYDGRGFKTIRYNPKDSSGLSANAINNIERLQNNHITLYYSSTQADDFNLRTFKVSRNSSRDRLAKIPNAHWQTNHVGFNTGNWFFMMRNHRGMGWMNGATGKIYYANKANGLLQQDTIHAIVQSSDGKIYLVNENGVQVGDTSARKFKWIPFATNVQKEVPDPLSNVFGEYFSIIVLPENRLAIAEKGILNLLDLTKRTSTVYAAPPPSKQGTTEARVALQADARGNVYWENTGRIYKITPAGEMKLLWENTANHLRISAFYVDRSDVLWVSVDAQGLLKIDLQALHFLSFRYTDNFILDILQQAGIQRASLPQEWKNFEAPYFFRQASDSKGNLFVTSNWRNQEEVYQLDAQAFSSFTYLPGPAIYSAMLCMPDDAVWVYDQQEAAWYRWKTPLHKPEKIPLDKASMKNIVLADAKFIGGYIWLSTYNHGLLQYKAEKRIHKFAGSMPKGMMPETLTEICADPLDKNQFWIGSRGGGLILWDAQKGLQRIFTVEDGLPNNTIYCILPDKSGKIWCSTNKGIFRFDKTTGLVTALEKTDGLPGNEFNRAHKFRFPDGRLAFGGLDGYTIFNPADFDSSPTTGHVPLFLTGLQINNEIQDASLANSLLKEPLSSLAEIRLPYNKNYLRFEFAALLFNQPQKTKYRYQLKGADAGWVENGTLNIASYSALRPGRYTFRMNATDNNGRWSAAVKEIAVVIHPPFWATWWAYIAYALAGILLVRWYFKFREQQLKTAQNLAFEKREALRLREVDELKDRFFSNITHEFRTPLTLIINPLEKLGQDTSLSDLALNSIKTAHRNSKQLLRLINEFLDFSKLNDGQLKLKLSAGEVALFTADCVQSFEDAAKEKSISLHFSADAVQGYFLFDKEKWGKIISNLLSNALKFTPVNGKVSVSLSAGEDDHIQLRVTDNGPGIPAEEQQKIFNRFYQVDHAAIPTYGGTGIGLSLVKELTGLMEGTIGLESTPGITTSFLVSVPMKKLEASETMPLPDVAIATKKDVEEAKQDAPLVLVVEDNDELRSFLVEAMCSHYRVLQAADGLKAWEIILQELPDIVISDVMMPGQDGFELCRSCKADNRTAHIGFILLTSKAAHDARLKGLGTGADDYITKPFNWQELEFRSANLIRLQQQTRVWLQAQLMSAEPPQQVPPVTDPFLLQLYQEMDAKLDDAELGVDYLSKRMAMSRSTLNRKLKALLDISTNDLIRQYRLQKATGLMSAGVDISTVAYQVGFSSPSYFTQCFKEKYGITPSDYVSRQH